MQVIRIKCDRTRPSEINIQDKASRWLGIEVEDLKLIDVYLVDISLSKSEIALVKEDILVDPVLQDAFCSYGEGGIKEVFEWIIQVGLKPGMKDGEGERTKGAVEDLLGRDLHGGVYTAQEYLLSGDLSRSEVSKIAWELLANDLINRVTILRTEELREKERNLAEIPGLPTHDGVDLQSFDVNQLAEISSRRNLALTEKEIESIRKYFAREGVIDERRTRGLDEDITDVELEAIAQTQSEHCKHKIFNAKIDYVNEDEGRKEKINSLMDTYIKKSSREIDRDWVLSSFWDNAGVMRFNEDYAVTLKFETHNSPSAKDPYGGSITGIVGVYRDPLGTGKGSKIIAGSFGFVTPYPSYEGPLQPEIKPRRLLEGIVEGVRDGGNKSGIPTITGYSKFDNSYLGKPLVYVGAVGLMPQEINGEKGWEKDVDDGDLIIIAGGRVGRDGIHGVTESSLEFSEDITSSHVQIGDPFTQKKVHDFVLEARDRGLLKLVWDLGGGGLSSAVGETAEFSGGCILDLKRAPVKYEGLKPWEILVSESQERMLLGIDRDKLTRLEDLAAKHEVEITCMGEFTDSGYFQVNYGKEVVGYLDREFLHDGFPDYELEAVWSAPELSEPDLSQASDSEEEFLGLLSRPNIASKKWIQRQYDHEVQGNTLIKPLVGINPVKSDASVIKPLSDTREGLALGLGNNFHYSKIDPYWMAASSLEESLRRVISVGADPQKIALNDNFTWPNSLYDEKDNPEGKRNLGKLVRANKALDKFTREFGTPCISGKDSMFITGNLRDESGDVRKVSGLPALQFSALGKVKGVQKCKTLVPQREGDLVYLIGTTRDELGGSEYYEYRGKVGCNVPRVKPKVTRKNYDFIHTCIQEDLAVSVHGIYRGGLAISLAEMAISADLGLQIDLEDVPREGDLTEEKILYSETPARFLITVDEKNEERVNALDFDVPLGKIGVVRGNRFEIKKPPGLEIIDVPLTELKERYYETFEGF